MAYTDREKSSRGGLKVGRMMFEILEHLSETDEVGVTELSRRLDINKSTAHAYLKTFEQCGYAINDGGKYRLSLKLLEQAGQMRNRIELYQIARDEIDKLARKTGEVAALGTEEQGESILLYVAEGENAVWDNHPVGDRGPIHVTAVGKAMLAHFSEERRQEIIDNELREVTEKSITDKDRLVEELKQTRERGYSVQIDEHEIGLTSYGVPIFGEKGTVIGVIAIVGPTTRLSNETTRSKLTEALTETVNVIEIKYKHDT